MTSKKIKGISISNNEDYERKKLADILPLNTPLSIDFHPSTFCNLKCIFCMHSSDESCYEYIKNKLMNFDLYKKSIDDMKNFPGKIKAIHFCGVGEPLMNKKITKMISYAKKANIAEKIDIVTNGILLNETIANSLLNSGIDFVRISVNGLSSDDFLKYTGTKIDFQEYVKNLTYLYDNRGNTKIYIKILDFMVDTEEKKDFFYNIFEPICDNINIENYNECYEGTKGKNILKDSNLSQRGEKLIPQKCCSQPFFKLDILPSGDCVPCAEPKIPIIAGNIKNNSIVDIWNSKILNNFRLKMLEGTKSSNKVCSECSFLKLCNFSSDNIDSEEERLKKYYQEQV